MVATANWFLIKWSIELGRDAFVLIQKSSFLPAWWLCLFQCQHNVGREELSLLCSTPHRDKGLEVQNALWWSGSHLLERGGKATIIGDCPNGKDGITGSCSFSSRNFSLPKKQERSQQMWLSQWSGWRAARNTVNVQKWLSRLAELGLNLWLCEPAWTLHRLESAKNQAIIYLWQWMLIVRYPSHSLTHSTLWRVLPLCAKPPARQWGFIGD